MSQLADDSDMAGESADDWADNLGDDHYQLADCFADDYDLTDDLADDFHDDHNFADDLNECFADDYDLIDDLADDFHDDLVTWLMVSRS